MIYRLGDLEIDLGRRELTQDGRVVKLTKLSFNLLEVLVKAAPDLVSYDELIEQVWGSNRVVTLENVSQRIKLLRQSLGDDAQQPIYLEAVRGEGVRLIPPVTPVETNTSASAISHDGAVPSASAAETFETSSRYSWPLAAALLVCLGLVVFFLLRNEPENYHRQVDSAAGGGSRAVAVLPFVNLSPEADNSFYVSGIHDEVLTQLAKHTKLKVISRTSMLRFTNTQQSIPDIAQLLQVDSVVEGSVRFVEEQIRVTVQLIDGASDEHLWSNSYDGELNDIFAIESAVARDVAASLDHAISAKTNKQHKQPPTDNLEAYTHYIKGRQGLVRRKPKELQASIAHFKKATELDPDYALAWIGLADATTFEAVHTGKPVSDTFTLRQSAIDRALELDPAAGEAWLALANLRLQQQRFDEAEQHYLKSLETNPGSADAHFFYAVSLNQKGRFEEALPFLRKSVALNPIDPMPTGLLNTTLWQLGRVEEALVMQRKLIQLQPNFPMGYGVLGQYLAQLGRFDEATYWAQLAANMDSPDLGSKQTVCILLLELDDDVGAKECFEAVKRDFPQWEIGIAFLHLQRGEYNDAIELLEQRLEVEAVPPTELLRILGLAYLMNNEIGAARQVFTQAFPQYFGTEEITLKPDELLAAVPAGITLYVDGETERANYLFDRALAVMKSMHRSRGVSSGMLDMHIHVIREDYERAITTLEEIVRSGWRIDWRLLRIPLYDEISKRPDWQALFGEIEKDIKRMRESYLAHKDDREYWECKLEAGCSMD